MWNAWHGALDSANQQRKSFEHFRQSRMKSDISDIPIGPSFPPSPGQKPKSRGGQNTAARGWRPLLRRFFTAEVRPPFNFHLFDTKLNVLRKIV